MLHVALLVAPLDFRHLMEDFDEAVDENRERAAKMRFSEACNCLRQRAGIIQAADFDDVDDAEWARHGLREDGLRLLRALSLSAPQEVYSEHAALQALWLALGVDGARLRPPEPVTAPISPSLVVDIDRREVRAIAPNHHQARTLTRLGRLNGVLCLRRIPKPTEFWMCLQPKRGA